MHYIKIRNKIKKSTCIVAAFLFFTVVSGTWARDFLTEKEITKMQDTQDVDKRTSIFMNAASLRLQTVLERFNGKDSEPGDALEFYSPQDMMDDYYKIMDRIMLVTGDAFESPRLRENINIKKALQTLKSESSGNLKKLAKLMQLAEEKQNKEIWDSVNSAIEITRGVLDGADKGLSILAEREREEESLRRR